jgi:hypothetical protein
MTRVIKARLWKIFTKSAQFKHLKREDFSVIRLRKALVMLFYAILE